MSSKIIDNLVSSAKKGSAEAFGELYEIYSKVQHSFYLYYIFCPFLQKQTSITSPFKLSCFLGKEICGK